jgi:hypothetical protein
MKSRLQDGDICITELDSELTVKNGWLCNVSTAVFSLKAYDECLLVIDRKEHFFDIVEVIRNGQLIWDHGQSVEPVKSVDVGKMKRLKRQFGTAESASFENNTWTFEMQNGFTVCAGEFAIVPKDEYDALLVSNYEAIEALKKVIECTDKGEFADAVITATSIIRKLILT